jgi:hypothetical protein
MFFAQKLNDLFAITNKRLNHGPFIIYNIM